MSDVVAIVPQPKAPCQACVENARHQDENFGFVWCGHVRFGGIYFVEQGQWQIVGPFGDESEFKRAMFNSFAKKLMAKSV